MGQVRQGAPRELILALRDAFKVRTFIETGTHTGGTTLWASQNFEQTHSFEASRHYHDLARARLGSVVNLHLVHGDSGAGLRELIPRLEGPACIWLDAHYSGEATAGEQHECPLLDELRAINCSSYENFILIDDARFFLGPPPPPHRIADWPGLREIMELLSVDDGTRRYVAIWEDVIVAVPSSAEHWLKLFLQSRMGVTETSDEAPVAPTERAPEGLAERIQHGLRKILR